MIVDYATATDPGMVRTSNQDSLYADGKVFIIADGMGGHAGGDVASKLAVEALSEALAGGTSPEEAVSAANQRVFEAASREPALEGMGTTVTMAVVDDSSTSVEILNIGDSRAYLLSGGELSRVTSDHTFVQELVDAGSITEEQASTHRARHVLTRVLGIGTHVEADSYLVPVRDRDRLLLCSDGLVNEIPEKQIAELLAAGDLSTAATSLVDAANAAGGNDNTTVIVIQFSIAAQSVPVPPAARAELTRTASAPARPEPRALPHFSGQIPVPLPTQLVERSILAHPVVRLIGFLILLSVLLSAVILAVSIYVNHSFFVGVSRHQVTIYQGRVGGILWFKPHAVDYTGVRLDQLTQGLRDQILHGVVEPSLPKAKAFVHNIESQAKAAKVAAIPASFLVATA